MSYSIEVGYKKKILEINRLDMWKRSVFLSYSRFFIDKDCLQINLDSLPIYIVDNIKEMQ